MNINALIEKVENREIMVIKRPEIEMKMGGAFCGASDITEDEFLDMLANSLKKVEEMNGMIAGDIEIMTDGKGNFAAKIIMGR